MNDELQVRVISYYSCTVDRNGTVHHKSEDRAGNREEWSEPLHDSPIRDVFGEWVWDLTLDPRDG